MIYSKNAFKLLAGGLISIASIAPARDLNSSGFKPVDPIAEQVNNDFCPLGDCSYLLAKALCDRNNIEHEARESVRNSWLYMLGLASKKDLAKRAGQEYVERKAYRCASSREGISPLEAEMATNTIVRRFEAACDENSKGKCSQFIGTQLEDMVDNVVAEIRAVRLQSQEQNLTIRQTQSTEEIEYSPSYRDQNSSCGHCRKYTSENTRVYLPKLEGDIYNINERGNRKKYESCCGAHLCFDCAYLFNNATNRICPCCSKTVDKLLVGELVNNKKGVVRIESQEKTKINYPEGHSFQPGAQYSQPSAPEGDW